ncbi:MAG: hypothetical protein NVSMB4_03970 [Acidimicrobiales bacterium]
MTTAPTGDVIGYAAGAAQPGQPTPSGDLTDEMVATCTWTDELVEAAGIPIVDIPFVSVGGGLGSFAMVDWLRIAGVAGSDIRVLTPLRSPEDTYRYLAEASQITDEDRLRSDSMSRIDNIWGWPSYALSEAIAERSLKPLWTVVTEPVLSEFFNPRAGHVYRGVRREAERISWSSMLVPGQVRMVRKRVAGGYFALLTPPPGASATKRIAYRARYVHVAVGYPSLRFLPDLQAYRTKYNDFHRVVNAYESHQHIYEALGRKGGTVVVRGAGIVASRILERLIDERDARGTDIKILHLFRHFVDGPRGPLRFRRAGGDGFTYQPFTFAKAAGGGQFRRRTMSLEGKERADFIRSIGGTTTARRKAWQKQLARGRKEGFYRSYIGEVSDVAPTAKGGVVTTLTTQDGGRIEVEADYVIDATGLEGDIRDHRLLADLVECGGAATNTYGRLDVDHTFEVRGTRSGSGRLYASGSITLGGYLAPVDSFWGLSHAALEISDDLARVGFNPRISTRRSIGGWVRWVRNTAP